jgi:hypothetical protein
LQRTLPEEAKTVTVRAAPDIHKIVVTNLFVNDRLLGWRQGGKFVVLFDPAAGKVSPEAVRSIAVRGPNDYAFDIRPHAKYRGPTFNGYIDDAYLGALWYMAIEKSTLLANGPYTVRVTYADGAVKERSRVLEYTPALSSTALAKRSEMHFEPSGFLRPAVDLSAVKLKWTTLKTPDGVDAYYSSRMSKGFSLYVDVDDLKYYDNILDLSPSVPTAGLNMGQSMAAPPLRRWSRYTSFVEMLDANDYEKINTAIFFETQWFATM